MLKELLNALGLVAGKDEFVGALRREFCLWSLPMIEQLANEESVERQIDKLIEICFQNRPMLPTGDEEWTDDGRLVQRRNQIMSLLLDHPNPWNTVDTVRSLSEFVSAQIAAVHAAQTDLGSGVLNVVEPTWPDPSSSWWPDALSPRIHYEVLGDSHAAQAARVEMAELMEMSSEAFTLYNPITPTQLAERGEQLRGIDNPIGRLLAENLCSSCAGGALQSLNARVEAVRRHLNSAL